MLSKSYPIFSKLLPIELSTITFPVKRVFFIQDKSGAVRGNHAHYTQNQFLVCLSGEVWVELLTDEIRSIHLYPGDSCYIKPMVWDTVRFVQDSSILVFCDTEYDPSDYVTNKCLM